MNEGEKLVELLWFFLKPKRFMSQVLIQTNYLSEKANSNELKNIDVQPWMRRNLHIDGSIGRLTKGEGKGTNFFLLNATVNVSN